MHAVVVRVTVDDVEPAVKELNEETIPRVQQAPGFVAGYWTRKDNTGLAMIVFESEEAAQGSSERLRENPPTQVTIEDVELREVVGKA